MEFGLRRVGNQLGQRRAHFADTLAGRAGDAFAAEDLDAEWRGPVIDLLGAVAARARLVRARPGEGRLRGLSSGVSTRHGGMITDSEQNRNPELQRPRSHALTIVRHFAIGTGRATRGEATILKWLGTGFAAAYQVDVVGFLWASMALFDDDARDVDTSIVYRPPWHDLHSLPDARQRILDLLASLPDGASLEQFLPAIDAEDDRRARPGLRRRSAWASTLLAGLELARQGDITLAQEDTFLPIHLRRAEAQALPATAALSR